MPRWPFSFARQQRPWPSQVQRAPKLLAAQPDAPRPHPLTTIGELPASVPYVDTSEYGQHLPPRQILYLIDERTVADAVPMVVE